MPESIDFFTFLAALGVHCCSLAFSSCGEWGLLFVVVRRLLLVVASLVAEHRLQTRRLSNCGSRAQLLCGMWDLPRPGLEPVSPALAGRCSTTAPPGKFINRFFFFFLMISIEQLLCQLICYKYEMCHTEIAFFLHRDLLTNLNPSTF